MPTFHPQVFWERVRAPTWAVAKLSTDVFSITSKNHFFVWLCAPSLKAFPLPTSTGFAMGRISPKLCGVGITKVLTTVLEGVPCLMTVDSVFDADTSAMLWALHVQKVLLWLTNVRNKVYLSLHDTYLKEKWQINRRWSISSGVPGSKFLNIRWEDQVAPGDFFLLSYCFSSFVHSCTDSC